MRNLALGEPRGAIQARLHRAEAASRLRVEDQDAVIRSQAGSRPGARRQWSAPRSSCKTARASPYKTKCAGSGLGNEAGQAGVSPSPEGSVGGPAERADAAGVEPGLRADAAEAVPVGIGEAFAVRNEKTSAGVLVDGVGTFRREAVGLEAAPAAASFSSKRSRVNPSIEPAHRFWRGPRKDSPLELPPRPSAAVKLSKAPEREALAKAPLGTHPDLSPAVAQHRPDPIGGESVGAPPASRAGLAVGTELR